MRCREHARTIPGRGQVFVNAYARALEVIPRQLCDNAGFDATDVLSRLRNKHSQPEDKGKHFGVDIATGAPLSIKNIQGCHTFCGQPFSAPVGFNVITLCFFPRIEIY